VDWLNTLKPIAKAAGGFFAIIFLFVGFHQLNESGYFAHDHDTPVWIKGSWMVGEYRKCSMMQKTKAYTPQEAQTFPRLLCSDDPSSPDVLSDFLASAPAADINWSIVGKSFHELPVKYYGRIDRSDPPNSDWRCQRLNGSLECKALN
jgi:hypothetical protein